MEEESNEVTCGKCGSPVYKFLATEMGYPVTNQMMKK